MPTCASTGGFKAFGWFCGLRLVPYYFARRRFGCYSKTMPPYTDTVTVPPHLCLLRAQQLHALLRATLPTPTTTTPPHARPAFGNDLGYMALCRAIAPRCPATTNHVPPTPVGTAFKRHLITTATAVPITLPYRVLVLRLAG